MTGLGALVVLVGLVGGAPIALLAFAGNPLPDHVPTLAAIGDALTRRDDGQLFLRALAVVGWVGWATFALSVLVELPFRLVRRPTPRLPGLRRQQRVAAALIGSAALVLIASPATAAVAATAQPYYAPATASTATIAKTPSLGTFASASDSAGARATGDWTRAAVGDPTPSAPAVARFLPASAQSHLTGDTVEPRYRVERGDYLGEIADRYLGEFDEYPELARLNKIKNPHQIRPGQVLRLPDDAVDHGQRPHASGKLVEAGHGGAQPQPGSPRPPADTPAPADSPPPPDDAPPPGTGAMTDGNFAAGTPATEDAGFEINRPLAVSAVIAAAGIVGAQVGTVFGLRRRPAGTPVDGGRHRAEDD